jgi:hypothetical protein
MKMPGWRRRRKTTFGGEMIKLSLLMLAAGVLSLNVPHPWALRSYSMLLWLGLLAMSILGTLLPFSLEGRFRKLHEGPHWRLIAMICLATYVVITFRSPFAQCPHATYFMVGPACLAWSNRGGPCHNVVNTDFHKLSSHWYFAFQFMDDFD